MKGRAFPENTCYMEVYLREESDRACQKKMENRFKRFTYNEKRIYPEKQTPTKPIPSGVTSQRQDEQSPYFLFFYVISDAYFVSGFSLHIDFDNSDSFFHFVAIS